MMHVYDLSNDQFMNTYEIKDTLENVEFEKIIPYPKGCNYVLVLADEGVYIVRLDLNNTQSSIICLKSNQELEGENEGERI